MLKIIFKYIGIMILIYPIGLVLTFLDNVSFDNVWLVVLLLDVLICSILCVLEIKDKNKTDK